MPADRGGGAHVVISQPEECGLAVVRVVGFRERAGVLPDQVVHEIAAAGGFGDQVMIEELVKTTAGRREAGVVKSGGGVRVNVRSGVQSKATEQLLLAGGEVLVGQIKGGRDGQVFRVHEFEPVVGGCQIVCQPGCRPGRMMVQLTGKHTDRQREVPAQLVDRPDRRIRAVHVRTAGEPDEQSRGLIGRHGFQADGRGVVEGAEMPAAGDQDEASWSAGEERFHLLMAGGVVQQQQDPLAG